MEGILSLFLGELSKYGIRPSITTQGNTLRFEISEGEFRDALLRGVPDTVKRFINIRIEHGKIVVEVRLF